MRKTGILFKNRYFEKQKPILIFKDQNFEYQNRHFKYRKPVFYTIFLSARKDVLCKYSRVHTEKSNWFPASIAPRTCNSCTTCNAGSSQVVCASFSARFHRNDYLFSALAVRAPAGHLNLRLCTQILMYTYWIIKLMHKHWKRPYVLLFYYVISAPRVVVMFRSG